MIKRLTIGIMLIIAGITLFIFKYKQLNPPIKQKTVDEIIVESVNSPSPNFRGEIILDSKVNEARKRETYFFYNLRFGMLMNQYNDSLNRLLNFTSAGTLKMKLDKGELEFEIHPVFEKEYLQSIELISIPSEITINTKLKERTIEESLFYPPFFSVNYTDSAILGSLIELYRSKYGAPVLLKGSKEVQTVYPDISNYIKWITQFNRTEKSDWENKNDSMEKYKKYINDITEKWSTDTLLFKNDQTKDMIQFCYTKRIFLSKVQLTPASQKKITIKDIHIIYTPVEAIQYRSEIKLWEDSLKHNLEQNEKESDDKLKKATKDGI